jgi:hypothetical protein
MVLFGAGDWAEWADPILRNLGANGGHAAVVAAGQTANGPQAVRWYRAGAEARFDRVGIRTVHVPLLQPGDGDHPDALQALDGAAFVYVLGGGPRSTVLALRGSFFWRAIVTQRVPFVGSSGGAMLVGSRFPSDLTFTTVAPALGTNPHLLVAGHWNELDEMRDGLQAAFVTEAGDDTLLGIDRDTGIDGDGCHWTVVGSGRVVVRSKRKTTSYAEGESFASPEEVTL